MEPAINWLSDITYKSELILDILKQSLGNKMSRINSHKQYYDKENNLRCYSSVSCVFINV